ncbi:MAG TPA: Asp-tRNA(Asn)/Glu-tRNA(Gln) amidotransferase subunit GatA [Candidatus Paceibacterota bacterium]|jgi:aspartyl-tRNA(Asn)/glutamyl-tRNA(Gln) amidotransferase subunit A|nr:Asp-tRNA(Asn)/Glu-tRNA(Gln) amidotransferase subunit GatA [Candidatus Paceibacterota bacterium]
MSLDITKLTIKSAAEGLRKKDFSACELAESYLERIEERNPERNAYLEIFEDVRAQAEAAQKTIDSGAAPLLAGIPLAMKDNILIKGRRASSASKILEGYTAAYDSTAAKKLKEAGAVFLGRTNMDEFAMGSSTENSAFGVVTNPHDVSRVSGGSSGGSAAVVADSMALASLGSDTGGSIRQPASFCGVVGLKPTYGRVSRYGLMAMASSLDQIGPFAKTVSDAELIFDAIKGADSMDSTTLPQGAFSARPLKEKMRIGIPEGLLDIPGLDGDVRANFEASVAKLKAQGHEIVDVPLPYLKYSLAVYYVIVPAEVSSNLARFDGVKYGLHKDGANLIEDYFLTRGEGFGPEARRRILLGTYVLSSGYYDAYYNKAVAVRRLIEKDFAQAFEAVDAIVTPTTPSPAFKIGEKANDPMAMYLADIFTVPANVGGICGISLPSGEAVRDGKNLPLGFQILAGAGREDILFALGKKFLGEE